MIENKDPSGFDLKDLFMRAGLASLIRLRGYNEKPARYARIPFCIFTKPQTSLGFLNIQKARHYHAGLFIVIAAGFEPATDGLEGRCSIQLSYATKNRCKDKNNSSKNKKPPALITGGSKNMSVIFSRYYYRFYIQHYPGTSPGNSHHRFRPIQ